MSNRGVILTQIITFFTIWLVAWLPLAVPLSIRVGWKPFTPSPVNQKLPLLACLYFLIPFLLPLFTMQIGGTFEAYGFNINPSFCFSLIFGLGIGVFGMILLFALELVLGWVVWQEPLVTEQSKSTPSFPTQKFVPDSITQVIKKVSTIIPILLLALWVSITEEIVFRGFLLHQLQLIYTPWVAAALASSLFALLHLIWDAGSTVVPQLPGLWLMGMVLTMARWLDGNNLGLACGLHGGWVWVIASLDSLQSLKYSGQVSPWVTGWRRNPIAGMMGITFLVVTGIGMYLVKIQTQL